jgi:hypothetical protein
MSLPLVFIGGNKGGVGKSLASMALLDYWLASNSQRPVFLIETDTSNPDVAKTYGPTVPHFLPQLSEREGWIDLINELDSQPQTAVVCNLAAQTNSYWEQFGTTLLTALQEIERPATCLWMINRQRDSLELLAEFCEMAPGVKTHVLRNAYFGDERKFELYNGSEIRKNIEAAGGKSVTFPELADRITDQLYTHRLTLAQASGEAMPLGSRSEVHRWRIACASLFQQLGL